MSVRENIILPPEIKKQYFDKDRTLVRVKANIDRVKSWFEDRYRVGLENMRFYWGEHWTQTEIAQHLRQNRTPYVFNEIYRAIENLNGIQIQTRLDAKAVPREKSDQASADILSTIIKWIEQVNNIEKIENKVFLSGIVKGAGASVIRWEVDDVFYGYPKIEYVPIEELYWDTSSIQEDLSDAKWMARVTKMSRAELYAQFPQFSSIIEKATKGSWQQIFFGAGSVYEDKVSIELDDEMYEEIPFIEYYEKLRVPIYFVMDGISDTITKFYDEKEAISYKEGLIKAYTDKGELLIDEDTGNEKVFVFVQNKVIVAQTIIIGDEVASIELTHLPDFPYSVYFAMFMDGVFWSVVDMFKSPQLFINRMISQIDYQIGTMQKNMVTVIPNLLLDNNPQKLEQQYSQTNPLIFVKSHDAIRTYPNTPINPEYFQVVQFGINRIVDYAGGPNALGLQQNAAESGRAVIARAEMGGLMKLPLFERLRIWRQNLIEKAIWFIKNIMPPGQMIRVIGEDEEINYLELTKDVLASIKEMKYDIVIEEAIKTDTMRERYFQIMKEMLQVMPDLPSEIRLPILVEYSPLPQTKKDQILNMLELYQQYIQQRIQMGEEQKLIKEAENSVKRRLIKRQLEEQAGLSTQKPAPKPKKIKVPPDLETKVANLVEQQQQEDLSASQMAPSKELIDLMGANQQIGGVVPQVFKQNLQQ